MKTNFFIPALLLVLLVLASCSNTEHKQVETGRYVKIHNVQPESGDQTSIFNGIVSEQREVALPFRVGGPVNQFLVNTGDYVEKGQVIARIDKRDYKINLQTATAQFNQVKAEYDRYQELYDREKLPANTLDKIKAGYLMAQSQLEAAQNALADTDLKAPFAGYISAKLIENFETVGAGYPIVKVIDVSTLEVTISVPESQINRIEKIQSINCDIANAEQFNVPATVKTVNKKSGSDRLFEVKLLLNTNNSSSIKSGMVAKANVHFVSKYESLISVPVEAVFAKGNQSYVWVINPSTSKVVKTKVTVDKLLGTGNIVVTGGINIGDVVVSAGVHYLNDNELVKQLPLKSNTNIGGLL